MVEFDTKVIEVIKRAPGVKSFRFKNQENAGFRAGQWFFLTIKVGEEDQKKPFSFSNSPTEKGYIEFTKRITDSDFSKTLDSMEAGRAAKISMPYGNFSIEDDPGKVVFLSGGIGITPVRSMCKYAADMKLDTDMVLLYGNAREEDIVFKQDFDRMQAESVNFRAVYTLTCPEAPSSGWQGCCGFINVSMLKNEIPDYDERVFYVCGPPTMVKCLVDELKDGLQIPQDRIRMENFVGYE